MTGAKTAATARPVAILTDVQLADEVEQELAALTPRARAWTLAVAAGAPYTSAAEQARLSTGSAPISRLKRRAGAALRLLGEQTRRASLLTREAAIERFRLLSEEARAAMDYSAAARALREACLLASLYPDARLQVEHSVNLGEVSPEEWAALATLRHQVRRPPAGSMVVEALPAAPKEAGSDPPSHLALSPGDPDSVANHRSSETDHLLHKQVP